jgi:hypothetical protein
MPQEPTIETLTPDEVITGDQALDQLMTSNRQRMAALAEQKFELDVIGLIADQITILVDLMPKEVQKTWMTRVELALHGRLERAESQIEEIKSEQRKADLLKGVVVR